jgi:hypothetical protein
MLIQSSKLFTLKIIIFILPKNIDKVKLKIPALKPSLSTNIPPNNGRMILGIKTIASSRLNSKSVNYAPLNLISFII